MNTFQETETPTRPATLAMSGISKYYAGVAALTDVSVEIHPGEVHAILGENGAGKSTLMNIASGQTPPSSGSIAMGGQVFDSLTPTLAGSLGVAIVHQHPAVLGDMTVEENLRVALPSSVFSGQGDSDAVAQSLLTGVGLHVHLKDRVETLTLAQKHLLEIAKAFARKPTLLILDEPTAPLGREAVDLLFGRVREAVAAGTSVVYITHRLAEVRELADRVTVLRDGKVRGTANVDEITDDALLALIVGRTLESTFPAKIDLPMDAQLNFDVAGISGPGFADVSIAGRRGEIIGVAGVVGNGQSELLRALAGLESFDGTVTIGGTAYTPRELLHRAAFMPADRHREGLMMSLNVRENAAISALKKFRSTYLLSRGKELDAVTESLTELSVKAPSLDAPVGALSGGNQQKVVIARALLSDPVLLIADEPTQGVDVGARVEIYRILREASANGIPVIIASSDAKELEGLCDRVIVMSRGHLVRTLSGDEITEQAIVMAAVSSTTHTIQLAMDGKTKARSTGFRRFLQGDYAPSALLVAVIVVLGGYVLTQNPQYLGSFNIFSMLMTACGLGAIALGQTIPLLLGGIDLSVGPLAGFLVVIASFFVNDGASAATIALGLLLMIATAATVGLVNAVLIRYLKFTPIAATLTLYIALGGFAFLLRDTQGGYINTDFTKNLSTSVGPIPVVFIVLVAIALLAEYFLRKRRWGWNLRAVGSNEESARSVGVPVNRTVILGYVLTSLFVFLGAIILMTQIGIGDPAAGSSYTLTSITAVVLGGTSLLGGRGTFIGSLLGAILLTQVLNATTVLGLGSVFQYVFQGLLILIAAIVYSVARSRRRKAAA
ncbi:ATP-binding cassette domain-containing protein [Subtercola frigoramans]|uniref:Ribose transport system ATP-binding protein n=1 Tax=Subtercola frigoramans TaxID=120298 RepID=A0ABS2L0T9_9MICO|nr:ATP-binding cassette domain-containing protein [Subtercola frigoramans]MBM7470688.1 ribose transport system ATP-binding protein [Subtercola frigoramans]